MKMNANERCVCVCAERMARGKNGRRCEKLTHTSWKFIFGSASNAHERNAYIENAVKATDNGDGVQNVLELYGNKCMRAFAEKSKVKREKGEEGDRKKITSPRYLQWKRADRANNNNIRMPKRDSMHGANDTRKCVIFIYFDFMRIFSFMWLPIFESGTSDWIHCFSLIFFFRCCCSSKPFSLLFIVVAKKVKNRTVKPITCFFFQRVFCCCCHIVSHRTYTVG